MGVIFVVLGFVLAGTFLLEAVYAGGRLAFEPLSAAEERCQEFRLPADVASAQQWHDCVQREMVKGPVSAATPWLLRAGAALAVSGAALTWRVGRRRKAEVR